MPRGTWIQLLFRLKSVTGEEHDAPGEKGVKSTFWQWLTNPQAEVDQRNIMPEETTNRPTVGKPLGVREIALGVYLGALMLAGTGLVAWFIWTVFADSRH